MDTRPVEVRSSVLEKLRIFQSGEPIEASGTVVASVREGMGREPQRYRRILDRIELATHRLEALLHCPDEKPEETVALFRESQRCLEELGVVPESAQRLVRQIEDKGGAAKISGAGSLTGPGAGALLVYHPQVDSINHWDFLRPFTRLDARIGAEGARLESVSS